MRSSTALNGPGHNARRLASVAAVMSVIALGTARDATWPVTFAVAFVCIACMLRLLVRARHPEGERLIHVAVLAASSPFLVSYFVGRDLTIFQTVHVAAVLAVSVSLGYLLATAIRKCFDRRAEISPGFRA